MTAHVMFFWPCWIPWFIFFWVLCYDWFKWKGGKTKESFSEPSETTDCVMQCHSWVVKWEGSGIKTSLEMRLDTLATFYSLCCLMVNNNNKYYLLQFKNNYLDERSGLNNSSINESIGDIKVGLWYLREGSRPGNLDGDESELKADVWDPRLVNRYQLWDQS